MKRGRVSAHPLARRGAAASIREHWPEYLMEAAALGLFMISAGAVTTLVDSPDYPLLSLLPSPAVRRALVGVAMGGTAMGIIYSPWGRRSGAHMNPAITLAYLRLGKIAPWDAAYYVVFQILGGLAGVILTSAFLGAHFTRPPVDFVVTVPGWAGVAGAWIGEGVISVVMMAVILAASNHRATARYTGLFAGILISLFVTFESPLSGFGMNPARTLSSALPSGTWTAGWLYFMVPPLGMLLAAEAYVRRKGRAAVRCCKLHHRSGRPCIFCGRYDPDISAGADGRPDAHVSNSMWGIVSEARPMNTVWSRRPSREAPGAAR
jgi:aquaporin Z